MGNGSDEVLAMCFYAFFTPGKAVVFPDITYSFYPVYARLFGLDYREIPLDENFGVPVEQFLGVRSCWTDFFLLLCRENNLFFTI